MHAGWTDGRTREDSATQLLIRETLSDSLCRFACGDVSFESEKTVMKEAEAEKKILGWIFSGKHPPV